jgi:hypothetical protein
MTAPRKARRESTNPTRRSDSRRRPPDHDAQVEDVRAERERAFEYARGGLLIAVFFGGLDWETYHRIDDELRQAAERAGATWH